MLHQLTVLTSQKVIASQNSSARVIKTLYIAHNIEETCYGNIPVYCDQEECLLEVENRKAGGVRLQTVVTAVEQSQANGRAEQRVRALRERRLHIMVEDAGRCGVGHHP